MLVSINGATRPVPGLGLVLPHGVSHRVVELAPGRAISMVGNAQPSIFALIDSDYA